MNDTSVTISGLTSYESVTDNLDHTTFSGGKSGSVTLTAAELNSGLSLNSSYTGSGKPVNTLSVTASNTILGEMATTTAPQTITVTDPPEVSNGGTPSPSENTLTPGLPELDDWQQHLAGAISGLKQIPGLSDGPFFANATLGYPASKDNAGGGLNLSDGAHAANLARLGSYIASSFVSSSDGHGGTYTDPSQTQSTLQSMLAHPHA